MAGIYSDNSPILAALNAAADRRAAYSRDALSYVNNFAGTLGDWITERVHGRNALKSALAGKALGTDAEEREKMKADQRYGRYADDAELFELWKRAKSGDTPLGTEEEMKALRGSMDDDMFAQTVAAQRKERKEAADAARDALGKTAASRDETARLERRADELKDDDRMYAEVRENIRDEILRAQDEFRTMASNYSTLVTVFNDSKSAADKKAIKEEIANAKAAIAKFCERHPEYIAQFKAEAPGALGKEGAKEKPPSAELKDLPEADLADYEEAMLDFYAKELRNGDANLTKAHMDEIEHFLSSVNKLDLSGNSVVSKFFDNVAAMLDKENNLSLGSGDFGEYSKVHFAKAYKAALAREEAARAAEFDKRAANVKNAFDRIYTDYSAVRSDPALAAELLGAIPTSGKELKRLFKAKAWDKNVKAMVLKRLGLAGKSIKSLDDDANPREMVRASLSE